MNADELSCVEWPVYVSNVVNLIEGQVCQVESLAGAAHLLEDNGGVLR